MIMLYGVLLVAASVFWYAALLLAFRKPHRSKPLNEIIYGDVMLPLVIFVCMAGIGMVLQGVAGVGLLEGAAVLAAVIGCSIAWKFMRVGPRLREYAEAGARRTATVIPVPACGRSRGPESPSPRRPRTPRRAA